MIDQRAFRLVGKFKVRELDAKVIDEDRAPYGSTVCFQQNILDVQTASMTLPVKLRGLLMGDGDWPGLSKWNPSVSRLGVR